MNWDDLRFLLAAARAGSLSGAAQDLGVNHATVGRRLDRLEDALNTKLFERLPDGLHLTQRGRALCEHADAVERDILRFEVAAEEDAQLSGSVRLSLSSAALDWMIAPLLADFRAALPDIELDIVVSRRQVSLSRREADIAIRFTSATVEPGAPSVLVRRVGRSSWHMVARNDLAREWGDTVEDLQDAAFPYANYNNQSPVIPGERFIAETFPKCRTVFRCDAYEGVLHAIEQGIAYGLTFTFVEVRDQWVTIDHEPVLPMDIWVAIHPEARASARVRSVRDFFVERLKQQLAPES